MRWWWHVVLVVVAVGTGCGADEVEPTDAVRPAAISSSEYGFTAELPAGWELAAQSLTPNLRQPVEILSAGTMSGLRHWDGAPGNVPYAALGRMGARDAFVTVQESHGNAGFSDRPTRFTLPAEPEATEPSLWAARNAGWLDLHWFDFHDARRDFYVLVALGRQAPPERRAQALALLESLRFESSVQG